jgi:MoxR-like ATPase
VTQQLTHASSSEQLELLVEVAARIRTAVDSVVQGKPGVVRSAVSVLLAGGHLLIEDVPGVGKTVLAKALARSIDGTVRRIQFTPDLLPADVTGVSVFNPDTRDFEFRPGGIFAHVVIGDEINRASPKTQSALLECMAENQVTVDGNTYRLEPPFLVIATQNPVEMEGTYALPEAQRDRFMMRVAMGYPSTDAEMAMLSDRRGADPLSVLTPVTTTAEVAVLIDLVQRVYVSPGVQRYAVGLAQATREHPDLRLGASPRSTLHLIRAAQADAALDGRDFVLPDDVQALVHPVLEHRLLMSTEALMGDRRIGDVLDSVVARVPLPDRGGSGPGVRAGR